MVTLLLATVAAPSSMAQVPEQVRAAINQVIGSRGTYIPDEKVYKVIYACRQLLLLRMK